MRLRILSPTHVIADEEARKVRAEGQHGLFTVLPRHVDYVVALLPGLLLYETDSGEERLYAIDRGVLVKSGADVRISTRNAVRAANLSDLRQALEEQLRAVDDHERQAQSALARLEASFVRQFVRLEEWQQ
jgi:F-type H+-transporting ATPase subunit epsilon